MSEPLFFSASPRLSSASLTTAFLAHACSLPRSAKRRLRKGAAPRVKAAHYSYAPLANARATSGPKKRINLGLGSYVGCPTEVWLKRTG